MDEHYIVMHSDTIPVPCSECPVVCLNKAQLISHLEWHQSEDRVTRNDDLTLICHLCGKFYPEGDQFNFHTAICKGVRTPSEKTNFTYVETICTPSETHIAPHNMAGINGVQTNYDLLKKVVTDTIYSDTPAKQ